MLSGVTIEDPETTYISPDSTVGADTTIRPNTFIMNGSTIGEGNVIGPNTYLDNVHIGNDNVVEFKNLKGITLKDSEMK